MFYFYGHVYFGMLYLTSGIPNEQNNLFKHIKEGRIFFSLHNSTKKNEKKKVFLAKKDHDERYQK